MKHAKDCSAILLAGGFSSRMGRCKAELDWHGVPLVRHQAEKLRSLGIGEIVLSGYAAPVEGTVYAPDLIPHRGPLSGIHAGLLAVHDPCALVIPVDAPLLPEELLRRLIRAHTGGVTLVSHGGEPEPLIAVYDRALAGDCEEILRGPRTSVRRLLERAETRTLEYTGDLRLLANCNTPEEYREICEQTN